MVRLGTIEVTGTPVQIEAPATASVGEPVHVVIATFGGGCHSIERTDVDLAVIDADIYPFDRERIPGENEACPQPLLTFLHEISIVFVSPGSKTLRVHGVRWMYPIEEPITIVRTLTIE